MLFELASYWIQWHVTVFTVLKFSTHEENERNVWKKLKCAIVQIAIFLN
jgi:predicted secreted protein